MALSDKEKKRLAEELASQIRDLNGWDRGQIALIGAFGGIGKEKLDAIKNAVAGMIGWHLKQHSKSVMCEYCESSEQLIQMYKLMESYYLEFEKMVERGRSS